MFSLIKLHKIRKKPLKETCEWKTSSRKCIMEKTYSSVRGTSSHKPSDVLHDEEATITKCSYHISLCASVCVTWSVVYILLSLLICLSCNTQHFNFSETCICASTLIQWLTIFGGGAKGGWGVWQHLHKCEILRVSPGQLQSDRTGGMSICDG